MSAARFLAVTALAALLLGQAAAAADDRLSLTIRVSGGRPGTGHVICSLFASAADFLKRPLRSRSLPIDEHGRAEFRFDGLPAGTYAASVVYDEDGNGELNTGLFGIPTELIGMSNNARGSFGPPAFEQAAFALTRPLTMEISLGKARD